MDLQSHHSKPDIPGWRRSDSIHSFRVSTYSRSLLRLQTSFSASHPFSSIRVLAGVSHQGCTAYADDSSFAI